MWWFAVTHVGLLLLLSHGSNARFPPVLNIQNPLRIAENKQAGTTIGTVTATDTDNDYIYVAPDMTSSNYVTIVTTRNVSGQYSGNITLKRPLDYETDSNPLLLSFTATDRIYPTAVQLQIQVIITDVNDRPPMFLNLPYATEIPEDAEPGRVVFKANATDTDLGIGGQVYIYLQTNTDTFSVATDGTVTLTKKVDYETLPFYRLELQAGDGDHLNRTTSLFVTVTDVQDSPPYFTGLPYITDIIEGRELNTSIFKVTALDGDRGNPDNITFTQKKSTCPGFFEIHPNGDIFLKGKPDRDSGVIFTNNGICVLTVQADEVNVTSLPQKGNDTTAIETVTVTVKDINDNDPTFSMSVYNASIPENSPPGFPLTFLPSPLTVEDKDQGEFAEFNMTLDSYATYFELVPSTVQGSASVLVKVKNSSVLDFEQRQTITLTIRANQHGRNISSATIHLDIENENDNTPAFLKTEYSASVQEGSNVSTSVITISASDEDLPPYNSLSYSLLGADRKFNINSSGEVYVASTATDRETRPVYYLTVEVDDGDRKQTTQLTVNITDANDNAPQFNRDYDGYLSENTTHFNRPITVKATDNDIGSNAQISYTISRTYPAGLKNHFHVNRTTGHLLVTSSLDYENLTNNQLVVAVEAKDSGSPPQSTVVNITLIVQDINDNIPTFNSSSYRGNVSEDAAVDTSILHVFANDLDGTPQNSEVFYMLEGTGSDRFQINGATGVIAKVGQLDREDVSQYNLTVRVMDRGTPPRNSTASVVIDVDNVNDEIPSFSSESITKQVNETKRKGILFNVTADDEDEDSHLDYTIMWNESSAYDENSESVAISRIQQILGMDSSTGDIVLRDDLDREEVEIITLKLHVIDQNAVANKPQTATATLTIRVMDVDDNSPNFNQSSYTATIVENAQPGIPISLGSSQYITVSDADKDQNSVFSLSLLNHSNVFEVIPETVRSSATVLIRVKNSTQLDYEKRNSMILTLRAIEKVPNPRSSYVTIYLNITDANDHDPVFANSYNVTIPENSTDGHYVVTVTATDRDSPEFGMGYYSLQGTQSNFEINNATGEVTVARGSDLDRERQAIFLLRVEAEDKGARRSSAILTVHLSDTNDNPPIFTRIDYNDNLKENSATFARSLKLEATDADQTGTGNALVSYELYAASSGITSNFSIDNVTGILTPKRPIDYESLPSGPSIKLVVIARDHGNPALSSNATVTIQVEDINDNTPHFSQSTYRGNISEAASTDTSVLQVNATDHDGTAQNNAVFYILKGTGSDRFQIDGATGVITKVGELNADTINGSQYHLVVEVIDRGNPPRSSTASVVIDVDNINDENPIFHSEFISQEVNETKAIGHVLYTIQAEDPDQDADLRYSVMWNHSSAYNEDLKPVNISEIEQILLLNASTGDILLNGTLDREKVDVITLKLHVTDHNAPVGSTQTATATLRLTVIDIDDNSPEFNNATYAAKIEENSQPGIPISLQSSQSITVSDKDKDLNSVFSLSLRTYEDVFEVVPQNVRASATVIIRVKNGTELDYESTKAMNLTLLAKETNVANPRNSSVTIFLSITDANDHYPVFNESAYNVSIPENGATSVVKVMATDEDSSLFDMGTYRLQGSQSRFGINSTAGLVYVTDDKNLDRERQDTYRLVVEAKDKGGLIISVPITVHLTDVNDNKPVFTRVEYNANLKENANNFSRPLIIQTTDADEKGTNNSLVSYQLLSSGLAANFSIGKISGMLTPNGPIDYELLISRPNIELVVIAKDNGIPQLSSNVTVTIQVEDVNDNTPLFNQSSYRGNITESAAIFTSVLQVFATDKDGTIQNRAIFYMLEGTGSDRFQINGESGLIKNIRTLDREDVAQYNLTVRVMDRGTPPLNSTAEVVIGVINVNDEPPSFSSELISSQVNETNSTGSVLIKVPATDPDSDFRLLYKVFWNESSAVNGNLQNVDISRIEDILQLDNATGELLLIGNLDREEVEFITLKLHVVDLNAQTKLPQTATATLTLTVLDVDDNAPSFNHSFYKADIEENSQPGIPISLESIDSITVNDRDKDLNSVFSLTLLRHNDVFEVVPKVARSTATVIIRVKNNTQLDFERHQSMTLTLLANETRVANPLSSTVNVTLSIKDVNDHDPVFENDSYTVSIPENSSNGYDVVNVTATDKDSPQFGMGTFNLQGSLSTFAINNVTGEVYVASSSSLDRERQETYRLIVEAVDKGGRRSSVQITIHLTDVNDNSPVFLRVEYNANLKEGDVNFSKPLTIQATDADEHGTKNAEVSYHLESLSSGIDANFSISPAGVITPRRPIDYELLTSRPNIKLIVIAKDRGSPPLSSNVTVTIQVQDINDNTPHFRQSLYHGNISEDAIAGTSIVQVNATDNDATTQNSAVFYTLEGTGSDRFRIDGVTGIITNIGKLDREDVSQYNLTVRVMDRGTPPLNSTAEVVIDVINVNDVVPKFASSSLSKQVNETNVNLTVLYTVSAKDNDPDSNLLYTIFWNESSAYDEDLEPVNVSKIQSILQLDSTRGDLMVIDDLDREKVEVISLVLHVEDLNAVDNKPQTATATLTLTVMDVDDNTPTFNSHIYWATIEENSQPGIPVSLIPSGAITVSDDDKDLNSVFSLSLLTHDDVFEVIPKNVRSSATVIIRVKNSTQLDYEETKSMNLTVLANETKVPNPRSSMVEIKLKITDANDNDPEFDQNNYTVSIPENSDGGYDVVNVTATDKDSPQFGMGTFNLQGSLSTFAINNVTGEVYVASSSSLDRERQETYRLIVEAVDKGGRRSSVQITIHLTDVNDNSPVFLRVEYNANLKEGDVNFSKPLTIQATDADEHGTKNAEVSYHLESLSSGIDANFSISPAGVITPRRPIDYELLTSRPNIKLIVIAKDRGSPPLSSNVTVTIQVQDINDNTPHFRQSLYHGNISEDAIAGTSIVQVNATDNDATTQNSAVFYTLEGTGSDRFRIDGVTGIITNIGKLDREDVSQYNLTVRVMDRGTPPLNSTAEVVIDVINVNDVVPKFASSSLSKQVNETNVNLTVLYTVSAKDNDPDSNLLYTIFWNESSAYDEDLEPVNVSKIQSILQLDSTRGDLMVIDDLDREKVEVISLVLHVEDLNAVDNKPQTATATLTLTVMDVDDNTPTFNSHIYWATIEENSQPGIPVSLIPSGAITVSDDDKDLNSVFSLSLLTHDDVFEVIPKNVRSSATVIIRVKNSTQLDYEETKSMNLTVLANETKVPNPRSSMVEIKLKITDANDNDPEFDQNNYTVSIPENSDGGYDVVNVTATDKDSVSFNMGTYNIQGSQTSFNINKVSGQVYVANGSDLDRERQATYRLTVEAVDKGDRLSSVPVIVHLTDENDNSPVFSRVEYNANLEENDANFSRALIIQTTDADKENTSNSMVSYSILPQRDGLDANFSISETGVLTPKSPIDFELLTNGATIELLVLATDHGSPKQSSNVTVTIQVQDINDNRPIFNQTSYSGNVSETAKTNTAILQVFATDDDGTPQNSAVFYMLEGSGSDRFQINGATGVIAKVGELDREDVPQYNLTVRVMDRGIPPLNNTSEVTIYVINVNDEVPSFPAVSVSKQVNETNRTGSVLYTLSAIDNDPDSHLLYTVFWNESSASNEDLVDVSVTTIQKILRLNNATGGLVLTDVLDREEVEVIKLKLHVVDLNAQDNIPQTATAMLTLTVMDVDDNTPTFNNNNTYTAQIEENSQPGIPISLETPSVITVFDKDKDLNSIFSLSLLDYSDVFDVVPSIVRSSATVIIRVKNSTQLDYERIETMNLTLLANETRATNPHHSTVQIILSIKNVNDHAPVFVNETYTVSIAENRKNRYSVVNVAATDEDLPEFDMDYYELQGSQTDFAINNATGEVFVANGSDLDRERQDTYRLTVEAVDKGGRRSSAPLTVHLTDVNDNNPVFRRVEYNANLKEGDVSFSRPLIIETTDADEKHTPNSFVNYTIQSANGLEGNFSINGTGMLIPNGPIDYELLPNPPNIELVVVATDGGTPQLSSSVTVTIQVEDVNDNKPIFINKPYKASIPENATDGSFVTLVSGTDRDGSAPNNQFMFVIDSGGSDNFRVDGRSGNITVQTGSTLDRERVQNYALSIMVIDQGTPPKSSSTTVSVTITDVNDEPPVFDMAGDTRNVMENTSSPIVISSISASDPDENCDLNFFILWNDSKAFDESDSFVDITKVKTWFSINSTTGDVTAEPNVIDRETAERVTLRVQVTDLHGVKNIPQTANASLTVIIDDKNDNYPDIQQGSSISLNVSEGTMVGTVILSLDASDRDKGQTVTFSTNASSFNITKKGRISLAEKLDRETSESLSFLVYAADNGNTSLTSTANISVTVLDINDNDPYFSMATDVFPIEENSQNGTFIAQLVASDNDTGPNANVTFLFPDYFGSHFTINAATGEIKLGKTVDRETKSSYKLTVVARDNPTFEEPRRVRKTITINVTDVNDNNPIFSGNYVKKVSERTDKGEAIITVTATDADIGKNAELRYSIDQTIGNGSDLFNMNFSTGSITAKKNLTGLADTYVLTVVATDMGVVSLTGNTSVTVIVLDENLNAPVFVEHGDIEPVPECAKKNSWIYQFSATDADRDKVHNGHVEFKMAGDTQQDTKDYFSLEKSGKLFTKEELDSEVKDRFMLKVSAYDLGVPSLSTLSREYIIKVRDINDYPPKFNTSDTHQKDFAVDENLLNVTLGPIRAEDPDKDSHICYKIKGVSPYSQHYVEQLAIVPLDNKTANIRVVKPFDRENITSFSVKVTATDCSPEYYSKLCNSTDVQDPDSTIITIHVNDVNDNPPKFDLDLLSVGIRNTAPAEKVIYKLENSVTDADTTSNSQHRYTQVNATRPDAQLLGSSFSRDLAKTAIKLNGNGTVQTNMAFSAANVGYFSMTVAVNDSAGVDFTELRIYIIADFQVLKITFLQTPEELRQMQERVLKKLSKDTGFTFISNDDIASPTDANGEVMPSRSVMFLHAVNPDTGKILDAEQTRKEIDSNQKLTQDIITDFKVLHVGEADAVTTEPDDGKRQTFILIAIIALLAFTLCLLVFISFNRIHRYRRKLKAATIEISAPARQVTEKSGVVNVNPIFNKDIAYREEAEQDTRSVTSHDSLDENEIMRQNHQKTEDDEQEITVDFFDEGQQIRYGNNFLDLVNQELGQRGHDVGDSASSGSDQGESHNNKKAMTLGENQQFSSLEDLESSDI